MGVWRVDPQMPRLLDVETTPYPIVRSEGTLELQPVTIGVRDVKLRTPQGRSSGIPSGATPLTVRVFIGIRPGQVEKP